MEVANIDVTEREERGRTKVRQLRASGHIPAVIYGQERENIHLSVPGSEFTRLVMTHHKLYQLHYPGGRKVEAYLQDLQWDALDDCILHADFKRIDLSQKMQTDVELTFVGQPKGLAKNGVFETAMQQVRVECLPADLPESIRIVVNGLDVGESLHVSDLPLPDGVVSLDDAGLLVCHCKLRHESLAEDEEEAAPADADAEPEVIGKEKKDEPGDA